MNWIMQPGTVQKLTVFCLFSQFVMLFCKSFRIHRQVHLTCNWPPSNLNLTYFKWGLHSSDRIAWGGKNHLTWTRAHISPTLNIACPPPHSILSSFDPITTEEVVKLSSNLLPRFLKTTPITLLLYSMLSNSDLQSFPLYWHLPLPSKIYTGHPSYL